MFVQKARICGLIQGKTCRSRAKAEMTFFRLTHIESAESGKASTLPDYNTVP
jgi:hypothetical protein